MDRVAYFDLLCSLKYSSASANSLSNSPDQSGWSTRNNHYRVVHTIRVQQHGVVNLNRSNYCWPQSRKIVYWTKKLINLLGSVIRVDMVHICLHDILYVDLLFLLMCTHPFPLALRTGPTSSTVHSRDQHYMLKRDWHS